MQKRLMTAGQGATAEESDKEYNNLCNDLICKTFIYFNDTEIIYSENYTINDVCGGVH